MKVVVSRNERGNLLPKVEQPLEGVVRQDLKHLVALKSLNALFDMAIIK